MEVWILTIEEIVKRSADIDQFFEAYSVIEPKANIFGAMIYGEADTDARLTPDAMYVVTVDKLPKALPGSEVFNFLLVVENKDDPITVPEMIRRRSNLLLADSPVEQSLNKIETIIYSERKTESAIRRITEALFASGIHKMVAVGAEQIKSPIVLVKNTGEVIDKNRGTTPEFSGEDFDLIWDKTEEGDWLLNLADSAEMETAELQHYVRVPGGKAFYLSDTDIIVMALPIRINKIEVGKVFGFNRSGGLPVLEEELLYRLSLIVGDELQKHNQYRVGHRQRYVNFMWMLLEGKYPNLEGITKAMEELDLQFKGRCQVALIHIINETGELIYESDMLHILSAQIEAKIRDILWIIHNNELVIMFNREKNEEISEYELSLLKKLSDANDISIGISHGFSSIVSASQLYWQAKQAAEFGYVNLHQKLTWFYEISHLSMVRLVQKEIDPAIFVDPKLMQLYYGGKENVQHYFSTLYYYLKSGGNTSEVAKLTHMHRNTVLYRIDKLQKKMGFNLDDGMEQMKLMLSFEILKYLELFNPDAE